MLNLDSQYYEFRTTVTSLSPSAVDPPTSEGRWAFVSMAATGSHTVILWARQKPPSGKR